ncbi:MAG: hypothetical protein ACREQX_01280, partial [Candidatus Binataceae bacterium]
IALLLAGTFFFVQMKQPFSRLWKVAAKFDVPQLANPEVCANAAEADVLLRSFYEKHRIRLLCSCLCYLVAWSMGPVEIYILLRLLHQPATWMVAVLVEALGLLIERATFLIPAKLVSQEGGKALILALLGYSADVGFAIGFLRRIKEMVWVMFGLAAWLGHRLLAERRYETVTGRPRGVIEIQSAQGGESL